MVTKCIEEIYDALAECLLPTAAVTSNPNLKHIVGLAGPPVAVKPPDVVVFPMDGFHLYCSQLDAMERRMLEGEGSVYVPSFDHGAGDPVEDDIYISLHKQTVKALREIGKKLGKKDWDFGKDPCGGDGNWAREYGTKGFEISVMCSVADLSSKPDVEQVELKQVDCVSVQTAAGLGLKLVDPSRVTETPSIQIREARDVMNLWTVLLDWIKFAELVGMAFDLAWETGGSFPSSHSLDYLKTNLVSVAWRSTVVSGNTAGANEAASMGIPKKMSGAAYTISTTMSGAAYTISTTNQNVLTCKGNFGYFARVVIDVDLAGFNPETLLLKTDDSCIDVQLYYESFLEFCSNCHNIGHSVDRCNTVYRWVPQADHAVRDNTKGKGVQTIPSDIGVVHRSSIVAVSNDTIDDLDDELPVQECGVL
ncbi:hypothetical protein FNV43_RR09834 [Rhamnella rubrinervis]|uniref:Zinc knuckle CX2CX4HX4C domain-containing protein n=1 Tax=Rhamnella rubrinervis TaxID=2594499 RepID=A0A8K0HB66_9ROSA|nr:hypothetical protein FNV43_RR09834 [Rhamnella rubrinervis]